MFKLVYKNCINSWALFFSKSQINIKCNCKNKKQMFATDHVVQLAQTNISELFDYSIIGSQKMQMLRAMNWTPQDGLTRPTVPATMLNIISTSGFCSLRFVGCLCGLLSAFAQQCHTHSGLWSRTAEQVLLWLIHAHIFLIHYHITLSNYQCVLCTFSNYIICKKNVSKLLIP